jgi:hypothetical protein
MTDDISSDGAEAQAREGRGALAPEEQGGFAAPLLIEKRCG